MSGARMRWKIAKLRGRRTLELQHEADLRSRDRAAKWLGVVEGKAQRTRSRPREGRRFEDQEAPR
jgi:hypothetical protein